MRPTVAKGIAPNPLSPPFPALTRLRCDDQENATNQGENNRHGCGPDGVRGDENGSDIRENLTSSNRTSGQLSVLRRFQALATEKFPDAPSSARNRTRSPDCTSLT